MEPIKEQSLRWLAAQIGLKYVAAEIDNAVALQKRNGIPVDEMMMSLLSGEYERRRTESNKKSIRIAGFSNMKYLDEIERDELPDGVRGLLPELETLEFIRQKRNIVFYGNPGTGKTHIATALGIKACMEGMSVMFASVPHLITQIKECRSTRTLHALENRFKKYDLVICDEFGYVSCDKEAGELLFNHLSLRADGRSTILTTNLAFERWGEIIRDKVLVSALIDRITQRAYLVNMNGESYRLKQTKRINSTKA